jgi:hypothetical protein
MFKCRIEPFKGENEKGYRVKDRQGHFLAMILEDGSICLYCKQCKSFHRLNGVYSVEEEVNPLTEKNKRQISIRAEID